MRNRKQETESFTKQAILWLLCICAGMYIIMLCIPGCREFNSEVQEGLHADPRTPSRMVNWNTHMDTTLRNRLDAVMDSMQMDCGSDKNTEWHGREGQSEYGEYESR